MKKLPIVLSLLTFTTLTSCDCYQNVSGTVVDAQTLEPIEFAHIQKENKKYDESETNDKGNFEITGISGGLFGCPPMTIIISKNGYETKKVEIDNAAHELIKLKKTE